eukprot:TRINITY_DN1801_c0_g2_i1.p2 TRINITY_DN1801_c0_g2~~TRINITY_DN1801_c0_g2_i1.p2  ORF type:complete len:671 (-),score=144.83 TRINITY_DN1801_c0_g2_i1:60-2072(-)
MGNNTIQTIDLSSNQLRIAAGVLGDILLNNTSVRSVVLANNIIGDDEALLLANALKMQLNLRLLDLSDNLIGDRGVVGLVDALSVNVNVSLLLWGNQFESVGLSCVYNYKLDWVGDRVRVVRDERYQVVFDRFEKVLMVDHDHEDICWDLVAMIHGYKNMSDKCVHDVDAMFVLCDASLYTVPDLLAASNEILEDPDIDQAIRQQLETKIKECCSLNSSQSSISIHGKGQLPLKGGLSKSVGNTSDKRKKKSGFWEGFWHALIDEEGVADREEHKRLLQELEDNRKLLDDSRKELETVYTQLETQQQLIDQLKIEHQLEIKFLEEQIESPITNEDELVQQLLQLQCEFEEIRSLIPISSITQDIRNPRLINNGCNGSVYRCNIDLPGIPPTKNYAIKLVFNYGHRTHSKIKKSFINELKYLCMLDHPNVIKVQGSFVGRPYGLPKLPPIVADENYHSLVIITDYHEHTFSDVCSIEFEDRQWHIIEEKMDQILHWFVQILQGVGHIHSKYIVHRDLKMNNLLLDKHGNIIVIDLGEGIYLPPKSNDDGYCINYESDVFAKGGNGEHLAPEIAIVRPGDGVYLDYSSSDIWACGVIFYEVLTGIHPFAASNCNYGTLPNDAADHQMREHHEIFDNVDIRLRKLISRLLKMDPNDRPSYSEAIGILNDIICD